MPHPANDFGAYRIAMGVCRLNPIFARMMEAVLDSAFARCLWLKKHCGKTYFRLDM